MRETSQYRTDEASEYALTHVKNASNPTFAGFLQDIVLEKLYFLPVLHRISTLTATLWAVDNICGGLATPAGGKWKWREIVVCSR